VEGDHADHPQPGQVIDGGNPSKTRFVPHSSQVLINSQCVRSVGVLSGEIIAFTGPIDPKTSVRRIYPSIRRTTNHTPPPGVTLVRRVGEQEGQTRSPRHDG
jgi:hypothetical protein